MPSTTFGGPGWHTFNVPTGVKTVKIELHGAGSGSHQGGKVVGNLAVNDKQDLFFYVGGSGGLNSGSTPGGGGVGGGAAGGAGHTGQAGGDGGGGATYVRVGSTSGSLKAVAGGAGGDSGDSGAGGPGGASTGGAGGRGNGGSNATGQSTGGTQSQGGNGGTSSSGSQFNGHNASDTVLAGAGAGGSSSSSLKSHGGGGGGGGYHPGGGGQASSVGYAPGGGGAGGSNFVGGLTGAASTQGNGGTGNGEAIVTWSTPAPANLPPTPPSSVKINGVDANTTVLTKATSSVHVSAVVNDPDKGEQVRLLVRVSVGSSFAHYRDFKSGLVPKGKTATVTVTGLSLNTHYYARLYSQDQHNLYSTSYNQIDFWSDQAPAQPDGLTINTQGAGMTLPTLSSATFHWNHNDPDPADYAIGFNLRYRTAASSTVAAGSWSTVSHPSGWPQIAPKVAGPPSASAAEYVFNPSTFPGNRFHEWQVQTRDTEGQWGAWSDLFSFYVSSVSTPPIPISPVKDTGRDVHKAQDFVWKFVDPDANNSQAKADLRYRVVGSDDDSWVIILGDIAPNAPGSSSTWSIPAETFVAGYHYEWQVRTYDQIGGHQSGWSGSATFIGIDTPGSDAGPLPVGDVSRVQGELGCGTYRVFVYEQGGTRRLGELEPLSKLTFARLRDDISNCIATSSGYSVDCGAFYGQLRSWMHELVVFRDGVRVWEGPITRITYTVDNVEIEAKDVMAYVYRRIMRQGYNDAYRLIKKGTGGEPDQYLGLLSVVKRAALLITDALAPWDPNVLRYLTALEWPDDANESRVVADWSRTAWEEVDDLAATAGLDYTTVGRRILLWDTHRAVGRLPELRDGDFSAAPIVTEYGMQLATFQAVTNGSGVYGWAVGQPDWPTNSGPFGPSKPYGPVEQLASSYADTSSASPDAATPEAIAAMQKALNEQAKRNISGRWPSPLIVRVPDNSTLSPRVMIGFQQLIPGVWMPLRSSNTARNVVQWQKLDSVSVSYESGDEQIAVVLSPAPNGGQDPDADQSAADAAN
jgi:hypothetical protein